MKTRTITLSELHRDPKNARKHNPRNIGMITKSIEDVGVGRSGVVDENGIILAGNGTFEALADRGISVVHEIETDGHEWVVVKRPGLSEEQKRKLALADNRASDLATWDGELLKAQGIELGEFFTDDELQAIDSVGFMPDFSPTEGAEQPRLDRKTSVICPECGHEFVPKS